MDFYKRETIPILEVPDDAETVSWDELEKTLLQHPGNVVFLETEKKLEGLIREEDIKRAKEMDLAAVPINRQFPRVCAYQFIKAKMFDSVPVVDRNGCLKGMCSRLDDLLYMEYSEPWKKNRYARERLKKYPVVFLADPSSEDIRRRNLLQRWEKCLCEAGVVCHHISVKEAVEQYNREGPILVTDEEMRRGIKLLINVFREEELMWGNTFTLKELENQMKEHTIDELITDLANAGVSIYNMLYTLDETTRGRKRLNEGFRKWLEQPDARVMDVRVLPSQAPTFYKRFYTEDYARQVGHHIFDLDKNNVYARLKDCEDQYFHIKNGERLTVGQPETAERTIWFFGQCLMVGSFVEDQHTMESFLQRILNRKGYSVKLVNCGCFESWYLEMIHMTSTPMKPGDIVVMFVENKPYQRTTTVDMMEILDCHHVPSEWLLNNPTHCNHKVFKIYAKELYKHMAHDGVLKAPVSKSNATMLTRKLAINSLYLDLHFADYTPQEGERVGTITMLGDPFTSGHRYLIETASRKADRLFVLLVEDELGVFSYAERFAMATDATKDLTNVTIVSGGPFQGTRNVFRKGLIKDNPADLEESAKVDIQNYAEVIAPRLGASCCFFGEERDNPKKSYYDLMKKLLPHYGIEAIELPKAYIDGKAISASATVKAAVEGDLTTLKANVPETTLRYFGMGNEYEE